jgi:hypothetical protein
MRSDRLTVRRRHLLQTAAAGSLATAGAGGGRAARAQDARPNILFIVADDLGYADLSCYGRRDSDTPNIDRIARGGLKLTQGYANASSCSPTRMAPITGRYQYRLRSGLEEPITARLGRGSNMLGLPPGPPTLRRSCAPPATARRRSGRPGTARCCRSFGRPSPMLREVRCSPTTTACTALPAGTETVADGTRFSATSDRQGHGRRLGRPAAPRRLTCSSATPLPEVDTVRDTFACPPQSAARPPRLACLPLRQ